MKARIARVMAALRRHSFWIALSAAAVFVLLAAIIAGLTALHRAEAWRARATALAGTERVAADWGQRIVTAAPAESVAWRRSERAVRQRGIQAADRVALMQLVVERAEDLGIADLDIETVSSDTLGTRVVRELDGEPFELAPYALSLEFSAGYREIASLVGALPPQVEVQRLDVAVGERGPVAHLILVVFYGGESGDGAAS